MAVSFHFRCLTLVCCRYEILKRVLNCQGYQRASAFFGVPCIVLYAYILCSADRQRIDACLVVVSSQVHIRKLSWCRNCKNDLVFLPSVHADCVHELQTAHWLVARLVEKSAAQLEAGMLLFASHLTVDLLWLQFFAIAIPSMLGMIVEWWAFELVAISTSL